MKTSMLALRQDEVSKPEKSKYRRADIQGLRAVAVLMVLAYHAGLPLPGGFIGVDVFFVISGFVITAMLNREWLATGQIRLGSFYLKRFFRLTPALAVMVAATLVVSSLLLSPFGSQQTAASTGLGALLLAANWVISSTTGGYFDTSAESNPLLNTWSLSVEEQFYVIFPALLLLGLVLGRKFKAHTRSAIFVVSVVGALSFLLAMLGPNDNYLGPDSWIAGFYSPFSRAWEFAAGSVLALIVARVQTLSRWITHSAGFAGAAMLLFAMVHIDSTTTFPGKWTVLPVAATILLLISGTNKESLVTRVLSSQPMVKVGDWSYSIYLWHWPMIVFASVLWPDNPTALIIGCILSFGPALASYRWVEKPFQSLRPRSLVRAMPAMAGIVLVPLVLAGALGIAADNGFWNPRVTNFQASSSPRVGIPECFADNASNIMAPENCVLNGAATGAPIYLLGDSNALMFTAGILDASIETNRPFTSFTFSSCPFVGAVSTLGESGTEARPGCWKYQETALEWLSRSTPGTVVFASADYYLRDPNLGISTASGAQIAGEEEKTAAYSAGLQSTIEQVQAMGHETAIVQPIPNFRLESETESVANWQGPQSCAAITLLIGHCVGTMDSTLEEISSRQAKIWDSVAQVGLSTNSTVVDLSEEICPSAVCSIERKGVPVYSDFNHLSVPESKLLAPTFARLLASKD